MPLDEFRVAATSRRGRVRGPWIVGLIGLAVAAGLAVVWLRDGGFAARGESPSATRPVAALGSSGDGVTGPVAPEAPAVAAAVRARQFDALEALFAEIVALESSDPHRGEPIAARAFGGLESAEPALLEPLLAWRQEHRESPFADYALALHYNELAWRARGGGYAAETPQSAFDDYRAWRAKALPLARAAVEREPRLVSGWRLLINLALGDPSKCLTIANEAIAALPASWRIRAALTNCLKPRWGGRYDAMAAVAREAERHADRNPRLRWLAGEVACDRANLAANDEAWERAERWIDEAIEVGGPAPVFVRERARILRQLHRYGEALAALDAALADWPDATNLLEARAATLVRLGREAEARAALDRVAAIDPADPQLTSWRRWFAKEARQACESLARAQAVDEAVARCREAAEGDPADAETRYWMGRALLAGGRYDEARQAFHDALASNPRYREAIVNLDWLYGREQRWRDVADLWDAYLELEPEDAKAWLERAGTRRRLGEKSGACSDLERACELGNSQACTHARRDC